MMRTGGILGCRAVYGAMLATAMTMTTARVRRTCRAMSKPRGKGREKRVRRVKGR